MRFGLSAALASFGRYVTGRAPNVTTTDEPPSMEFFGTQPHGTRSSGLGRARDYSHALDVHRRRRDRQKRIAKHSRRINRWRGRPGNRGSGVAGC